MPILNVLARDVTTISTHLQVFCAPGLSSATGPFKDRLPRCWKDRNRDRGATEEVPESSQKLHRLAVLATSPEGNSPPPDVVPPNPTMRVSGRSTVSGVFFCSRKCFQMTERDLGFTVSVAIHSA
jgi:hypothetical protein